MRTKEEIVLAVKDNAIIPIIRKFQTYKEYPLDLYHREFVISLRMCNGSFHQTWDNEKKWLNYTW